MPRRKLLLGVPFYARNVNRRTDARSYGDLANAHNLGAGSDSVGDYYFNGVETMKKKAVYAQQLDLGGIMVWEIGQDTTGGKSLLHALHASRR